MAAEDEGGYQNRYSSAYDDHIIVSGAILLFVCEEDLELSVCFGVVENLAGSIVTGKSYINRCR